VGEKGKEKMRLIFAAAIMTIPFCISGTCYAGEIGKGYETCDIQSTYDGCSWQARDCRKPWAPLLSAHDVASYNEAVSEFNAYISEVDAYRNCVVDEAKRDAEERLPVIVSDGVKQQLEGVARDLEEARHTMDLIKP
jgi:hypothetical protein